MDSTDVNQRELHINNLRGHLEPQAAVEKIETTLKQIENNYVLKRGTRGVDTVEVRDREQLILNERSLISCVNSA